jgi:DNA-binding NarL/FixJ family response regulator
MAQPATVCIVEDSKGLSDLWIRKLKSLPDFLFLRAWESAETALPCLLAQPPDLVLVDWKLPGMDGITLIQRLKDSSPEIRSVLVTGFNQEERPFEALASGADGFLRKPVPLAELPVRLREVMAGHCPVSASVARLLVERLRSLGALQSGSKLSDMEDTVLKLIGEGFSTKQIAERLHRSEHTVVSFKRRIYTKLDAHNVAEALAHWRGGANKP